MASALEIVVYMVSVWVCFWFFLNSFVMSDSAVGEEMVLFRFCTTRPVRSSGKLAAMLVRKLLRVNSVRLMMNMWCRLRMSPLRLLRRSRLLKVSEYVFSVYVMFVWLLSKYVFMDGRVMFTIVLLSTIISWVLVMMSRIRVGWAWRWAPRLFLLGVGAVAV